MKTKPFIISRGSGKTGIEFMHFLQYLKETSKSEDDKKYFEQMQKEWSDFNVELTLGYWNKM
jgi:hypothetical protein